MRLIFSFVFLYFFVSLSFGADKTGSDTISIINRTNDKISYTISYSDKFNAIELVSSSIIGEKQIDFLPPFPYMEIKFITPSLPLWLKKGEQYDIYNIKTYEVASQKKSYKLQYPLLNHTNPELNNEALFFFQLDSVSNGIENRKDNFKDSCLQAGVYHLISQELHEKQLHFLENYKEKISSTFYNFAKQKLLSDHINRLFLAYEKQAEGKEEISTLLLTFKSSTQNDDMIFCSDYRRAIDNYNKFLVQKQISTGEPEISQLYDNIKKEFSGISHDYLLFNLMKVNLRNKNIPKTYSNELVSAFMNDCKDVEYKEYIQRLIKAEDFKNIEKDILVTTNLEQIPLNEVLEKFKGKIIYIDFWASWCIPCRANMKPAHHWKEHFKNDVVFLYISLDQNLESWLKANKIENLNNEHSFALPGKAEFYKKFKSSGIPHYILIDRNGKIIDNNAIRPTDKNFEKRMNKVINK